LQNSNIRRKFAYKANLGGAQPPGEVWGVVRECARRKDLAGGRLIAEGESKRRGNSNLGMGEHLAVVWDIR